jgi:hypothetical protein
MNLVLSMADVAFAEGAVLAMKLKNSLNRVR